MIYKARWVTKTTRELTIRNSELTAYQVAIMFE